MKNSHGLITVLALLVATTAVGAETAKKDMSMMTPEMRQKMADVHQKMSACLKSDKPMSECKTDMKMGMGNMRGMMGGGKMMMDSEEDKKDEKK